MSRGLALILHPIHREPNKIILVYCQSNFVTYREIPIISPGLILVQTTFWLGLFSGELIFRGAYYWEGILRFKFVWN